MKEELRKEDWKGEREVEFDITEETTGWNYVTDMQTRFN